MKKEVEKEYKVSVNFSTVVNLTTMHKHAVQDLEPSEFINLVMQQIDASGGIKEWLTDRFDKAKVIE